MYNPRFDISYFLTHIWQRKPVLIRKGFENFIDPISPEELAGLATEDEVSSRVVVTKADDWEMIHGPFQNYERFGESHWQLLVQAANHWHETSSKLAEAFRFLPDWRFDDLMISFATQHGGAGPHIDNYDVFIIQGSGKRHWKVGDKGRYSRRNNDPGSSLIEDFDPIIDTELEPGDILYIPPGFPHCGTTLTDSLSYSLGYRAPSQQELFSNIADYLIDNELGKARFISKQESSGKGIITKSEQQGLIDLLVKFFNSPQHYQQVIGNLLSVNRFELDICPDDEIDLSRLKQTIEAGRNLIRIGGLKIVRLEDDNVFRLFIDGNTFDFDNIENKKLVYLSDNFIYQNSWLLSESDNDEITSFLLKMCQQGYLYFT